MRVEAQFHREVDSRAHAFDSRHVVPLLRTHVPRGDLTLPDLTEIETLTKAQAEELWVCVMPMADRNLFVFIKQERFAGANMDLVSIIIQ
jgi:hypothetical protein